MSATQPRRLIRSAEELRGQSFQRRIIIPQAREVLNAIERTVIDASKEGLGFVNFEVPRTYAAIGDDQGSILAVNATVLNELVAGGYNVTIRELDHSLLFNISWTTDFNERDLRTMAALMARHTVLDG